ncbi:hypothetical protein CDAR_460851 [Caerostris darwini]|uniref:Uncharacterized protein n=1 Tax=Caerostris darwini TaxID=1538125 RepID=A0AAV4S1Z9_9ARAC|nr:hypothetical protein CDAR_460851 [Caerostris darwini]
MTKPPKSDYNLMEKKCVLKNGSVKWKMRQSKLALRNELRKENKTQTEDERRTETEEESLSDNNDDAVSLLDDFSSLEPLRRRGNSIAFDAPNTS